eukprot:1160192-Pelagomonas_calceolata.AAC.2
MHAYTHAYTHSPTHSAAVAAAHLRGSVPTHACSLRAFCEVAVAWTSALLAPALGHKKRAAWGAHRCGTLLAGDWATGRAQQA